MEFILAFLDDWYKTQSMPYFSRGEKLGTESSRPYPYAP